jgi:hypothetical protein
MTAWQAEGATFCTRGWRAAREFLAVGAEWAHADDIVVRAGPAGAANLMREVVALNDFDVALEELDGDWRVVIRGGPHPEDVLARIVDLTASCVEHGLMDHATLCIGTRSYTIQAPAEAGMPACAG